MVEDRRTVRPVGGGEAGDAGRGRDAEARGGVAPLRGGRQHPRAEAGGGGAAPPGPEVQPAAVRRVRFEGRGLLAEGVVEGGHGGGRQRAVQEVADQRGRRRSGHR